MAKRRTNGKDSKPQRPGIRLVKVAPSAVVHLSAIDSLPDRVLLRLASYSRNTQRALRADWRIFAAWCADPMRHADNTARRAFPLTPAILIEFIHACSPPIVRHRDGTLEVDSKAAGEGTRSASTVSRYLTSLRILHRFAEWPGDPTKDVDVQATRRIVMRGRLWSQPRAPLRLEYVTRILNLKGKSLWLLRDKALVAVAYSGMLRRSEMVALNVEDLDWDPSDGTATLTIRRSKTDQEGRGRCAFLPVFAVKAVRHWLRAANIATGPIFRRVMPDLRIGQVAMVEREVPRIFKRILIRIGIPAAEVAMIAGHSTRIGGAHDLLSGGFDLGAIMQAGGWSSPAMPARYTRELRVKNNAMAQLLARVEGRRTKINRGLARTTRE